MNQSDPLAEALKSAGVYPTGPVSAWPKERREEVLSIGRKTYGDDFGVKSTSKEVKATKGQMARGLLKTAGQAIRHGKVSAEIREERYNTCKTCPAFNPESKRCSDCGCFMEAKTWVGGNPDLLCPQRKWKR